MSSMPCDVCYKIMVLGDSGVGKTALMDRVISQKYFGNNIPTIGKYIKKINTNTIYYLRD